MEKLPSTIGMREAGGRQLSLNYAETWSIFADLRRICLTQRMDDPVVTITERPFVGSYANPENAEEEQDDEWEHRMALIETYRRIPAFPHLLDIMEWIVKAREKPSEAKY